MPVLIKNFRDIEGSSPNDSFSSENSRLSHRFFMYDTISGIKNRNGYKERKQPSFVRYAHDVRLTVQMDANRPEKIRKPMLEIEYREYNTAIVEESDQVPAHFSFDYYEKSAAFERDAEITVYVFNAVVVIIVGIKIYFWSKLNPSQFMARHFVGALIHRLIYYVCDVWSNVMFMVYFVLTMYWFIMYKMQANAHLLMPQRNIEGSTYDTFFYFLVTIIFTKLLAVILSVIDHTSIDIFVMDWERYEKMKTIEVVDNSVTNAATNAVANPAVAGQGQ